MDTDKHLLFIEKEMYKITSMFEGESPPDSVQGMVYALLEKVVETREKLFYAQYEEDE